MIMQQTGSIIKDALYNQGGFIRDDDLDAVIKENRLQPLLIRCGCGRFICPAQDAKHFIDIIEKDNRDYIRDVSIHQQR